MIENDRINWCDWAADGGALEYDLSYLHPELGVLLQEYQINSTTYEGKLIYQSDFYLFGIDSAILEQRDILPCPHHQPQSPC